MKTLKTFFRIPQAKVAERQIFKTFRFKNLFSPGKNEKSDFSRDQIYSGDYINEALSFQTRYRNYTMILLSTSIAILMFAMSFFNT